jgi:hypothetical protein
MAEGKKNELLPPSPEKVARRALILSVISCRGIVEGQQAASNLVKSACEWLHALNLEEELSDWERRVLTLPFGSLPERDKINASWLSEAVTVLAWSLGKAELPGFDEQCDPASSANGLGFLQPAGSTVLESPQLRSMAELEDYNNFIYNLHWRLRDFQLNRRAYDFESLARKAWGEPVQRYGLTFQSGDLSVGGVPISSAEEGVWRTVSSITQERHRASNWLVGYEESNNFYEVTTDT